MRKMVNIVLVITIVITLLLLTGCLKGEKGDIGTSGSSGQDGATGPAGQDGATGPAGQDGATGPAGQDGATGPAGQDGATGPVGQDAVLATYSYEFSPDTNPYEKNIPEIVLVDVLSGKQTVTAYMCFEVQTGVFEWVELPVSEGSGSGGFLYVCYHDVYIGEGYVKILSYLTNSGDDIPPDIDEALFGSPCRVVVKTFNK